MNGKEISYYKNFMEEPSNSHNCSECPENRMEENQQFLPCGQQNCWVDCHSNN